MMRSRILDIYARYSEYIRRLVPLQVEDAYLKIVIYFADGSNLRVTEEWAEDVLTRYSYYWLAPDSSAFSSGHSMTSVSGARHFSNPSKA